MRLFWIYFLIYEFQGRRVNAIAKTGGRRAVLEDMSKVSAASAAQNLDAHHAVTLIGLADDSCLLLNIIEGRPAAVRWIFGLRLK